MRVIERLKIFTEGKPEYDAYTKRNIIFLFTREVMAIL